MKELDERGQGVLGVILGAIVGIFTLLFASVVTEGLNIGLIFLSIPVGLFIYLRRFYWLGGYIGGIILFVYYIVNFATTEIPM